MSYSIPAHDAATLFPLMDGVELSALVADIRSHGLLEPIVMLDGQILDGRNRHRACELAGVKPIFVDWQANGVSPTEWVVSHNLHRRHLTPAQRAVLALDLLPRLEAEARERQGERHDIRPGADESLAGRADEKAAALVGVGRTSVADVKAIANRNPSRLDDLRSGQKSIAQVKRSVGLTTSSAPVKDDEPKVYFGKGDKWQEASEPLRRYLVAFEKRNYEFGHVNAKEAKKRVDTIDQLIASLTEARSGLEQRTHTYRLTA